MQSSKPVGVTVIVATLNRGSSIIPALETLLQQDHRPIEILVVDQSDAVCPELLDFARAHADEVRVESVGFRGLPRARNYGWRRARYDALVYVDDDVLCEPRMLSEHVRGLLQAGVGMVAGGIDEPHAAAESDPRLRFDKWQASPRGSFAERGDSEAEHVRGCNFAVWRWALEQVGGFDESLGVSSAMFEELECCLRVRRAGYRIVFHGEARLNHLGAPTGGCRVPDQGQYIRGIARNRALVIRRHVGGAAKPIALARQFRQCLGFARADGNPRIAWQGVLGMAEGWKAGGKPPLMSEVSTTDLPAEWRHARPSPVG